VAVEVSYRYPRPSSLGGDEERDLALATFTPTLAEPPAFFSGFAERAEVVAVGLLAVARVARTRFYVPPSMTAAVIRAADPVVTSDGERLRFESLSVCCGVYARLDLLAEGIEGDVLGHGTTNVDVNPPLRDALGRVRPGDPMRLDVGLDRLRVTTLDADLVERKVPLPGRWLKSLAEVAQMSSTLAPRFTLAPAEARRVILGLPGRHTRGSLWLSPAGRSARLTARAHGDAVSVSGPERIADPLAPVLRYARRISVFGQEGDGGHPTGSAWVVDLPGARLTITLSPSVDRAFAGEGGVLAALADDGALVDAEVVAEALARARCTTSTDLAARCGLPAGRVGPGLDVLAASGRVGHDAVEGRWFARDLPFQPATLQGMHPRLAAARALVDGGAVAPTAGGAVVTSGDARYQVRRTGSGWRCSCPWDVAHQGGRGLCKHAVAASMVQGEQP
jgi:hypothetical protein